MECTASKSASAGSLEFTGYLSGRSLLGSLAIGFVLGFVAGFVLGVFGAAATQIQTVGGAAWRHRRHGLVVFLSEDGAHQEISLFPHRPCAV
jgi:hypothetical protein